ncbi:YjbQ family protein [candidate division KSB1 bacterium]|nr:MAG: YjbQ family protein [candidate division KSB1 bacterium]
MLREVSVKTTGRTQLIDITGMVSDIVSESGVDEGLCVLWVPHTTAAVTINENADPDVVRDILKETENIVPFEHNYLHREGNSAAHIKSSLFGPQLTLIISRSGIILGTWQSVYFCEFDGPRNRRLFVKIVRD